MGGWHESLVSAKTVWPRFVAAFLVVAQDDGADGEPNVHACAAPSSAVD
jgi:hypothetical protein